MNVLVNNRLYVYTTRTHTHNTSVKLRPTYTYTRQHLHSPVTKQLKIICNTVSCNMDSVLNALTGIAAAGTAAVITVTGM